MFYILFGQFSVPSYFVLYVIHVNHYHFFSSSSFNPLALGDIIFYHRSGSTLAQVKEGLVPVCHKASGLDMLRNFPCRDFQYFAFFNIDCIWSRGKLFPNLLAQLAVLLAPGCEAAGYVKPWSFPESIQAPSHYLNQCWHNSLRHMCIAQPQWVNWKWLNIVITECTTSHRIQTCISQRTLHVFPTWAGWGCISSGVILGLPPTNERRRYKVTPSLIGWAQTQNQSCIMNVMENNKGYNRM